jgi:hypothetical protein
MANTGFTLLIRNLNFLGDFARDMNYFESYKSIESFSRMSRFQRN